MASESFHTRNGTFDLRRAESKVYAVRDMQRETLSHIAFRETGEWRAWRDIAAENNIADPFAFKAGSKVNGKASLRLYQEGEDVTDSSGVALRVYGYEADPDKRYVLTFTQAPTAGVSGGGFTLIELMTVVAFLGLAGLPVSSEELADLTLNGFDNPFWIVTVSRLDGGPVGAGASAARVSLSDLEAGNEAVIDVGTVEGDRFEIGMPPNTFSLLAIFEENETRLAVEANAAGVDSLLIPSRTLTIER